ncbi:enoyl-CoA hydratase [Oceanicoccus sagamiensis]|uniref:Enoyl-CoA hydratase n=1 Tax=Oceanicoccus sagamiensis TaxID=716816 RepID=A0A1X9NAN0_9GAMM|nr:enoyl-CoA hydratase [Oceanicoccus sagamiensis]ARN74114.1 enoyl-CoA hydratase [Oceanicoccus sagamiensis]
MAEDKILYRVEDNIAVITLNRPKQRNAQDLDLILQLDAAWTRAAEDKDVKVIVLNANGPHFSAGHDITQEAMDQAPVDWQGEVIADLYHSETKHYIDLGRKWRNIPKPSIAAVQGACIAAGLMLIWPCDLIIAADDARFSDPVVMMGIGGVEYHGHTWEFGARKAKELLFTSDSVDAATAEQLGMVNKVVAVDELNNETMAMAAKIAQKPAFGLAMAKRAVNRTLDIMGQDNAIEQVFDIHQLGHGNAQSYTGQPIMVDLGGMKKGLKDS